MASGSEYVVKLNAYAQKERLEVPQYKDLGSSGPPPHIFKQCVHFNGRDFPEGVGKSRKEAKQNAAKNACEIIFKEHQRPDKFPSEPCTNQSLEETNFISWISGYCQQHSYSHSYIEVKKEGPSHIPLFYYKLVIDKKDYPEAQGKTVKEAKQKAARMAWSVLQKQLGMESKGSDGSVSEDQIPITNQSLEETNFISKISGYCQQHSYSHSYIEVKKEGPSHDPLFYYKLVIDKKDYPEAQGKTVKEAKQKAARMAWSVLQKQLGMNSKGSDGSVSEDQIPITNQSLEETNFISKISGYCQQHSYSHSYIEVKKEGPSHDPLFYYKLVIDKKDYPEAQGKTVKEAKQKAAQRAWSDITKHLSVDSKLSDGSAKSDESELSVRHGQSSSEESWMSSNSTVPPNVLDADLKRESGNDLLIDRWRQSQFDSFEPLGDGAFGCVYKARSIHLDKFFAIKEIKARDLKKSLLEAKVLANLEHTNIVRYFNSWSESTGYRWSNSQVLFIQMELCDGGTLRSWIYEKNKESLGMSQRNQSLQIAQQILSGVVYIHSKKLIHRDLKPENIFFRQDGNVRIGDFGLVTQDYDEDEIVERTEDRGTPSYMAPEQVGVNYDRKVDVFALGLIFFELFWKIATGQERCLIWPDVRSQKLPEEFTRTCAIESRIIKNMLNENPKARPEASTLTTELEKWNVECNVDKGNQTI